ncbi:hypothetical protein GOP47_0029093 [Adiantum capillus-veneris]|nr:hypothetical protein GOP47_0029093 [Adiantum capillus-veneris]
MKNRGEGKGTGDVNLGGGVAGQRQIEQCGRGHSLVEGDLHSRPEQSTKAWMNEGTGPYTTDNLLFGQTTLSRSSSKTALGDDGEDDDFSCPFAVDDVDAEEKRSRNEVPESSASSGSLQQRSPDAAVGALIRVLKSAPPLQNSSYTSAETAESSLMFGGDERESLERTLGSVSPESRVASLEAPGTHKRATEALEELQLYKNLRDLMLIREEDIKRTASGSSASPG